MDILNDVNKAAGTKAKDAEVHEHCVLHRFVTVNSLCMLCSLLAFAMRLSLPKPCSRVQHSTVRS